MRNHRVDHGVPHQSPAATGANGQSSASANGTGSPGTSRAVTVRDIASGVRAGPIRSSSVRAARPRISAASRCMGPPCTRTAGSGIRYRPSMLVAFSVSPTGGVGAGGSVHDAVAAAVRIVRESGLPNRTDAMFTTLEGEWDEVFAVVKRATLAVQEYGPRVSLVLKADLRPGHTGELTGKVERLEAALQEARGDA